MQDSQIFVIGTGLFYNSMDQRVWRSLRSLTFVQHENTSRWQSDLWLHGNNPGGESRKVCVTPSVCLGEMLWVLGTWNSSSPQAGPEKPGNFNKKKQKPTNTLHALTPPRIIGDWISGLRPGCLESTGVSRGGLRITVSSGVNGEKIGLPPNLPGLRMWHYQKKGFCRCN